MNLMDELIDWLNEQLERRNLSGARASELAGLNRGAISEIVNGRIPGLEVCKKLARYFGAPPETVLRMAGHVSRPSNLPDLPHLAEFVERVSKLPPEQQQRIMGAYLVLLEAQEAVNEPQKRVLSEPAEDDLDHAGNAA